MIAIAGYHRLVRERLAPDEDCLTLMIDVGRPLAQAAARVPRLALASTALPYQQRVQAGLILCALGLPAQSFCLECTTSARAATEAVRALGSGLVLAADDRFAAALLLTDEVQGATAMAHILAAQSAVAEYPGLSFVRAGEQVVRDIEVPDYAEAAYLELTSLAAAGLRAEVLAFNPPQPRLGRLAARALGYRDVVLAPEGAGAAGPLLALFDALDGAAPGALILLVSYGAGSAADALLVRKGGG